MKYYHQEQPDTIIPCEQFFSEGLSLRQLQTADLLRAFETRLPRSKNQGGGRDYSEEAIPERDPEYCLPVDTGCEQATAEAVSAEVRLELARRLQELGMSRTRAAIVASL